MVQVTVRGAGTLHAVLERGGETVWEDRATSEGGTSASSEQLEGLPAGTYVLSATTPDGAQDAELTLELTWPDRC